MNNTYLCHYGRKGMKWGQHKFNPLKWLDGLISEEVTVESNITRINGREQSPLTTGPNSQAFYRAHGPLHVNDKGQPVYNDGSVAYNIESRMNAGRTVADRILAKNWDRPIKMVANSVRFYANKTRNATAQDRRDTVHQQGHGTRYRRATVNVTRGASAGIRNMRDWVKK